MIRWNWKWYVLKEAVENYYLWVPGTDVEKIQADHLVDDFGIVLPHIDTWIVRLTEE